MPRVRAADAPRVVHRCARIALRTTTAQRRRLFAQLVAGGDVWAWVLALNEARVAGGEERIVSYQALCRELSARGRASSNELSVSAARSVLRRYCDACFAVARARRAGDERAPFPRRRRHLVPVCFYTGTFSLLGQQLRLAVAAGSPPLRVRLARQVPYPPDTLRSVTLREEAGRLYVGVCAEVPVAGYEEGLAPDAERVGGVDLGVIHPYALAGADRVGLVVSGRALTAESRLHLAERRARSRAVAARAPAKGQRGSRRWRKYRRRSACLEARHGRRLHQAAKVLVGFALEQRIGTLVVGDPVGVLDLRAGRRHNQRLRDWRVGELKSALFDKAEAAGITVVVVDERGSSSSCPRCRQRVPKPKGRCFSCPYCNLVGHRDLVAAVNIAARFESGGEPVSMPDTTT
ncbi:MAG: transposase [Acidimicrobiales bacterium]